MYDWNERVQEMIDWIERHIEEPSSLANMSAQLGYSPYYCTRHFHRLTGTTLRDYIRLRRISLAALELRDCDARVLDIAVKYGFSSHEAMTRAFRREFGITPQDYRRSPRPIRLTVRAEVFSPYHYLMKERNRMEQAENRRAEIKVEHIPAHRFIGIWDEEATDYGNFWERGHDCDEVSGTIESLSHEKLEGQLGHTAGWLHAGEAEADGQDAAGRQGERKGPSGYFYGIPAPAGCSAEVPEGMERREVPESEYLVFFHPPYDYLQENGEVQQTVEQTAWNFDPARLGYDWNDAPGVQNYQRHFPEGYGYAVLRPVKKV
ncbi:AraC family transcriptional regulator [Saccharibacillus sp. CPCC 101409]|uniref:AraC family transcriptional regulator n=1 Tax=Saccharibacillus sp. CPCC 101409 TaxID=3058041 RepID=UPI002673B558|nr:AraC family transcriptional regulator [Saccharibacillus sp. CPCC 101409]MDO3411529.1 AraC family transcriptional regulator [Saccharibacillus sp. CPCC 101409]